MRKRFHLLVIASAVAVTACGSKPATGEKPMDVKDTVFADQVRAVDKAKSVQDTVNQEKANLDKTIDANDSKLPISTD